MLVLALVVPRHIRGRRATGTWLAAAVVLPTIVVALLAARPLDRLKSAGELYVGGDDGFWQDTARSLVSSTLYRRGGEFLEIALVVVIAVLLVGGAVATVQAIGCRRLPAHAVAFVLLVTPAATSVALHHTSDSLFLIERTALFFVPLFAIWLALAADDLATRPRVSTGVTVAAVAVTVAAAVNLASAANFTHVLDWRYDASTKRMLGELDELRGDGPADLSATWLFEPTINYYRESRGLSWLPPMPMDCRGVCVDPESAYQYVIGPEIELVQNGGARVIRTYPLSDSVLTQMP